MTSRGKYRFSRTVLGLLIAVALTTGLEAQETTTLIVSKDVYPTVDATVFSFTIEGALGEQPFNLLGGENRQFTLEPGTYTIREEVPEDWELYLIRCGTDVYEVGPVASGAVRLALEPGDTTRCRFSNSWGDLPPVPPPGPTDVPSLSPAALSILMMALSLAGAFLLRKSL
jgi:hypothetical protein